MPEAPPGGAWRVLVLAPFPPRLDGRHGGSRAIAQLLFRLARENRIALAVLRSQDDPPVDQALRDACELVVEVEIPPVGDSFRDRLVNRIRLRSALLRGIPTWAAERRSVEFTECVQRLAREWRPDIVQCEYRIMGQVLPALRDVSAKVVLVDPDPDIGEGASSRLLSPVEAWAWHSIGRSAARRVDALVVFTERDRFRVAAEVGSTPVVCIPLGYELPERPLDPKGTEPMIVCVGSFVHPPNIDCAVRLARDIFPSVRERVPAATLRIVGSHAPDTVLALAGDGVSVHADVPDVRPHLDAAALIASPIMFGGGMRVKILEAITSGKAVVASPVALEGLPVRDGREVVVAERDSEFVHAIVGLLRDADRRVALARAARRWAEEHLSLGASVRAYEELYEALTTGDGVKTSGRPY